MDAVVTAEMFAGKHHAQFTIGNQTFKLRPIHMDPLKGPGLRDAKWQADMLRKAFGILRATDRNGGEAGPTQEDGTHAEPDGVITGAPKETDQGSEPVAWMSPTTGHCISPHIKADPVYGHIETSEPYTIPLYTHPPKAEQAGKVLTDDSEAFNDTVGAMVEAMYGADVTVEVDDAWDMAAQALRYLRANNYLSPSSPVDTDGLVEGIARIAASELVVTDRYGNMPVPGSMIRGFNLFKSRLSAYLEEQRS